MVTGDNLGLKPDLVILDDSRHEAFVIDVAMPFEGNGTFQEARTAKERKYGHLKALLRAKGYRRVEVDAFIVGPLGSWDPVNDTVLQKLSVGRNYSRIFRHLCCTEAFKGSFTIPSQRDPRQTHNPLMCILCLCLCVCSTLLLFYLCLFLLY